MLLFASVHGIAPASKHAAAAATTRFMPPLRRDLCWSRAMSTVQRSS